MENSVFMEIVEVSVRLEIRKFRPIACIDRDSRAILGAFGKSVTPQHLNQHQKKTRDDISLEKVKMFKVGMHFHFNDLKKR